jgi:hypothetical protein
MNEDSKRIEEKLDRILELLEADQKKMSEHIDFIENVYETVKSPFYCLMNGIKGVMNTNMITS